MRSVRLRCMAPVGTWLPWKEALELAGPWLTPSQCEERAESWHCLKMLDIDCVDGNIHRVRLVIDRSIYGSTATPVLFRCQTTNTWTRCPIACKIFAPGKNALLRGCQDSPCLQTLTLLRGSPCLQTMTHCHLGQTPPLTLYGYILYTIYCILNTVLCTLYFIPDRLPDPKIRSSSTASTRDSAPRGFLLAGVFGEFGSLEVS